MWTRILNLLSGKLRPSSPDGSETPARAAGDIEFSKLEEVSKPEAKSQQVRSEVVADTGNALQESIAQSTENFSQATRPDPDAETNEQLSNRWTAARRGGLVYAHKIRLDREPSYGEPGATYEQEQPTVPVHQHLEQTPADESTVEVPEALQVDSSAENASSTTATSDSIDLSDEHPQATISLESPLSHSLTQNIESDVADVPSQRGPERFSMLRAVANQWRSGLVPCAYLCVAGSASEARKLAPVIRALREQIGGADQVMVCVAGEHPVRTRDALSVLGIDADLELSLPAHQESLEEIRTRMIRGFGRILMELNPSWVVVQGDRTTAAMASIAAYYANVRVAHIDGGQPLHSRHEADESDPDVLHRLIASLFASVHFAETSWSKEALIKEGVPEEFVLVTGNTGVDAMHETCVTLGIPIGPTAVRSSGVVHVLVVAEMQETIAHHLTAICMAIRNLATSVPGLYQFVWPVQADVRGTKLVNEMLDRVPGVLLSGPANYEQYLRYLSESDLVLTDLEDVQEEAPSLGKPVLLMSRSTHRPEASRAGITTLIGADAASIQAAVRALARKLSVRHGSITNPYGDGKAAHRILDFFAGRQVLEFGRTALPKLLATGESRSLRRLPQVSAVR